MGEIPVFEDGAKRLTQTAPILLRLSQRYGGLETTWRTNCCAANRMRNRIASPEMFPEAAMLPHLICYRPMFIGGANDEADQHGDA